jgi:hypothetical protein
MSEMQVRPIERNWNMNESLPRKIFVKIIIRTMNLDFNEDDSGSIYVDDNKWLVHFPEDHNDVVNVTFQKDVTPGYAGDMAIRFSGPLQVAGFIVVVDAGYFEPTHQV